MMTRTETGEVHDTALYLHIYKRTLDWTNYVSSLPAEGIVHDEELFEVWESFELPTNVIMSFTTLCCLLKIGLARVEHAVLDGGDANTTVDDLDKIRLLSGKISGVQEVLFRSTITRVGLDALLLCDDTIASEEVVNAVVQELPYGAQPSP